MNHSVAPTRLVELLGLFDIMEEYPRALGGLRYGCRKVLCFFSPSLQNLFHIVLLYASVLLMPI